MESIQEERLENAHTVRKGDVTDDKKTDEEGFRKALLADSMSFSKI